MTKHRYRFGIEYFTNFMHKHTIVLADRRGNKLAVWRKKSGQRNAQMWAFPIPPKADNG